jgi:8-oxo-dGTP diphosphatase
MARRLGGAVEEAATLLVVTELVRAAGGVLLRGEDTDRVVALVHRPRYDDWSFPKGKLADGEDDGSAALREVMEETGMRCSLGPSIGAVTYLDRLGREKLVRYFEMRPDGGVFVPNAEVDQLRWLAPGEASRVLSYVHDRALLRRMLPGLTVSPVYLVRHAKAGHRSTWIGVDAERPLTRPGREQARRLVERFDGFDVERILTSPLTRCVQSIEPLAAARGLEVEVIEELRDGGDLEAVIAAFDSLDERPTVLCGHGRELEALIEHVEATGPMIEGDRGIAKGSIWVLERERGRVVSARYLPPPAG